MNSAGLLTSPVRRIRGWGRNWPLRKFVIGLILGGTLSGLTLGVVAGLVRPVPGSICTAILLLVVALGLARDWGLLDIPIPENRRLVPKHVLDRGNTTGPVQFGFEVGTGVRTFLPTAAPHLLAAGVLLLGVTFTDAVIAGVGFGIGRSLMPLLRYYSNEGGTWDTMLAQQKLWLERAATSLTAISLLWIAGS